jgi:hypothetical protein
MPISLKPGEYTSTFFSPNPKLGYQVEIYFLPPHQTPLELDWKIVDESGALIQQGAYDETDQMGGNDAIFERNYRPKGKSPQRILVSIHQGIQEIGPDTRVHVGIPDPGMGYGAGLEDLAAKIWMIVFAGSGVIIFLLVVSGRIPKPEG